MAPETLLAEYVAGANLRQLSARHGIPFITVHRRVRRASAKIESTPRELRETHMQDRLAEIAAHAGKVFELRPGMIWDDTRKGQVVRARHATFLVAQEQGIPQIVVARAFEVDPSSVSHGRVRARMRAAGDWEFARCLAEVRNVPPLTPAFSNVLAPVGS